MRAVLVVAIDEVVELRLLLEEVCVSGFSGLELERAAGQGSGTAQCLIAVPQPLFIAAYFPQS